MLPQKRSHLFRRKWQQQRYFQPNFFSEYCKWFVFHTEHTKHSSHREKERNIGYIKYGTWCAFLVVSSWYLSGNSLGLDGLVVKKKNKGLARLAQRYQNFKKRSSANLLYINQRFDILLLNALVIDFNWDCVVFSLLKFFIALFKNKKSTKDELKKKWDAGGKVFYIN